MTNTAYIMVVRLINVERRFLRSEGIDLLMPGTGTTGKRYRKITGSAGYASYVRKVKDSRIRDRIRIKLLSDISVIYTILLSIALARLALLILSNFGLLQPTIISLLLYLASLIRNFLSYG